MTVAEVLYFAVDLEPDAFAFAMTAYHLSTPQIVPFLVDHAARHAIR